MKNFLVLLMILTALEARGYSQTRTYDIVTYTHISGWTLIDKPEARTFSVIDKTNETFGLIAIYPAVTSSGSAQKDYTATWNGLVKPLFGAGNAPAPSIDKSQEGYEGLRGSSFVVSSGKQSTVLLVNYTGGGKTLSIIINYSDIKYETAINKFLQSIKLKSAGSSNEK